MTRTCAYIDRAGKGCPALAEHGSSRCAAHERPRNAPWTKGRDTRQQARDRANTLRRDHFTCQRCGRVDPTGRSLDAHHVTPTRLVALCNECHCAVDPNARRRT